MTRLCGAATAIRLFVWLFGAIAALVWIIALANS
jgi:hypothetical protein